VEPSEVVAVLAALFAGYLTGRGSAGLDGATKKLHRLAGPVRATGHVAGSVAGQLTSSTTDVARRVASAAGAVPAMGLDAARGAAAGAGFGFLQYRAARHVRAHPPRAASEPRAPRGGSHAGAAALADPPETAVLPMVLVTGGTRFHRPGCSAVRGDVRELTRDEALAEGRAPCRSCNP
jgi:hypothetical protein